MSLMTSSLVALVATLALSLATAYPTKDEEAYYYNRLHDQFPESYKEVRNLDGIDTREDSRPMFALLSKTDEDIDSDRGQSHYKSGSGLHLDGIGGGHLVRGLELEQGLKNTLVNAMQPVDVGGTNIFGTTEKFPQLSKYIKSKDPVRYLNTLRMLPLPKYNREQSNRPYAYRISKQNRYVNVNNMLRTRVNNISSRHMDSLGGGHLLSAKNELLGRDGDDLLRELKAQPSMSSKYLDLFGEGHLLGAKTSLNSIYDSSLLRNLQGELDTHARYMDSLGGGHLLGTKKSLDSIGGGNLLRYLANEPKVYIPKSRRENVVEKIKEMDALGGGHLLRNFGEESFVRSKSMDSLGGRHLLGTKKDLYLLGGDDRLKNSDRKQNKEYKQVNSFGGGHLLGIKKEMDALGGGHLLRDFKTKSLVKSSCMDSLQSGDVIGTKRDLASFEGGYMFQNLNGLHNEGSRYVGALGGQHNFRTTKAMDALGGGHLLRDLELYPSINLRYMDSIGGGHLLGTKRDLNILREDSHLRKTEEAQNDRFIKLDTLDGRYPIKTNRDNFNTEPNVRTVGNIFTFKKPNLKQNDIESDYACFPCDLLFNMIEHYVEYIKKQHYSNNTRCNVSENYNLNGGESTVSNYTTSEVQKNLQHLTHAGYNSDSPHVTTLDTEFVKHDNSLQTGRINDHGNREGSPFNGVIELSKIYIPYYSTNSERLNALK